MGSRGEVKASTDTKRVGWGEDCSWSSFISSFISISSVDSVIHIRIIGSNKDCKFKSSLNPKCNQSLDVSLYDPASANETSTDSSTQSCRRQRLANS